MPRHIDKGVMSAAAKELRALPGTQYLSAREAVAELEPDIRAAMKKGYTLEAIAERLKPHIEISHFTLKGYLYGKDAVNKEALRSSGNAAAKKATPASKPRALRTAANADTKRKKKSA